MKLLFLVPRFHTNLFYRLKALTDDGGYDVSLGVLYRAGSEHEGGGVTPTTLGYTTLYRAVRRFLGSTGLINPNSYRWKVVYAIPSMRKLVRFLKDNRPDVVLIRANRSLFTVSTILVARILGCRTLLLVQTGKHAASGVKKKLIQRILIHVLNVERIISPIENTLNTADPLYAYAPFTIDLPAHDVQRTYCPDGVVRIISVGKFQHRKGHLLLLQAICRLLDDGYRLRVSIVGEDHDLRERRRVENFIADNDLSGMVTIFTQLPHAQVRELYKEHDLFVLPSWDEPAAFSLLEAMAAKVPVVVSDTCGTKGYLAPSYGRIFESKNAQDLTRAITELIDPVSSIGEAGEAAFEAVQKNHSPDVYVKHLRDILQERV